MRSLSDEEAAALEKPRNALPGLEEGRLARPEAPYLTATRGSVSSKGSCGTSTPSR